jgi:hypothetical protein
LVAVGIAVVLLAGGLLTACGGGGDASEASPDLSTGDFEFRPGDGTGPQNGFRLEGGNPLDSMAEFLGVSVEQLEADLMTTGATQAGVAALYGKSREELTQFLIGRNREGLEQAVEEGAIEQDMADSLHEAFVENVDATLDATGGGFRTAP